MTTYDALFEHVLTRVDPERAHHLGFAGIRAAKFATRMYPGPATRPVTAMGLTFPSALGLAAGFDKNAVGIDALAARMPANPRWCARSGSTRVRTCSNSAS